MSGAFISQASLDGSTLRPRDSFLVAPILLSFPVQSGRYVECEAVDGAGGIAAARQLNQAP